MKENIKVLGKVSLSADGEWDINRDYKRLCVVTINDTVSYMSRKFVPRQTEITNKEYWQLIGTSNKVAGFEIQVVTGLPSTGKLGVIYLIKDIAEGANNHYVEYIWIDSTKSYEILGRFKTEIDLSNYQEKLVSAVNIKTINGVSILGEGNIEIKAGLDSIPLASSSNRGGIKIGYSQSGKKYPVKLENEKAYVEVPWVSDGATQSTAGLMSAADKTKLDNLYSAAVIVLTNDDYQTRKTTNQLIKGVIYVIQG